MNLPSFDFTNWREHPSDNRYVVFFFKSEEESLYFNQLLEEQKISFESYADMEEPTYKYYFALSKLDSKRAITLNHLTIGKFRSPFIANNLFRYAMIIGMILILGIGVIGYLKAH